MPASRMARRFSPLSTSHPGLRRWACWPALERQGQCLLPPDMLAAAQGVENLFERLDRMVAYGPTFCDITWGAGGSTADVTLGIATKMQNLVRSMRIIQACVSSSASTTDSSGTTASHACNAERLPATESRRLHHQSTTKSSCHQYAAAASLVARTLVAAAAGVGQAHSSSQAHPSLLAALAPVPVPVPVLLAPHQLLSLQLPLQPPAPAHSSAWRR